MGCESSVGRAVADRQDTRVTLGFSGNTAPDNCRRTVAQRLAASIVRVIGGNVGAEKIVTFGQIQGVDDLECQPTAFYHRGQRGDIFLDLVGADIGVDDVLPLDDRIVIGIYAHGRARLVDRRRHQRDDEADNERKDGNANDNDTLAPERGTNEGRINEAAAFLMRMWLIIMLRQEPVDDGGRTRLDHCCVPGLQVLGFVDHSRLLPCQSLVKSAKSGRDLRKSCQNCDNPLVPTTTLSPGIRIGSSIVPACTAL